MSNNNPNLAVANTDSGKPAEKKAWRVKRKSVSAELQAPAVRIIAHDTFVTRPNTDAIAQQFGNSRMEIVDAVCFEIHRRLARVESRLGFPAGEALPIRASGMVLSLRGRAA